MHRRAEILLRERISKTEHRRQRRYRRGSISSFLASVSWTLMLRECEWRWTDQRCAHVDGHVQNAEPPHATLSRYVACALSCCVACCDCPRRRRNPGAVGVVGANRPTREYSARQ